MKTLRVGRRRKQQNCYLAKPMTACFKEGGGIHVDDNMMVSPSVFQDENPESRYGGESNKVM